MKKLLIVLGLVLATISVQAAANFTVQSFLNCQSVCVTNKYGITNTLTTIGAQPWGTNIDYTIYTNFAGSQIICGITSSTNTMPGIATNITYYGRYDNLLKDVSLWTGDGSMPIQPVWAVSSGTNATAQAGPYFASIFIRTRAAATGADQAMSFVFAPVPDGVYEHTVSGDLITTTVTSGGGTAAGTIVTKLVPLDASKLIGCKALRLVSITSGDTDASSRADVLTCELVGFVQ